MYQFIMHQVKNAQFRLSCYGIKSVWVAFLIIGLVMVGSCMNSYGNDANAATTDESFSVDQKQPVLNKTQSVTPETTSPVVASNGDRTVDEPTSVTATSCSDTQAQTNSADSNTVDQQPTVRSQTTTVASSGLTKSTEKSATKLAVDQTHVDDEGTGWDETAGNESANQNEQQDSNNKIGRVTKVEVANDDQPIRAAENNTAVGDSQQNDSSVAKLTSVTTTIQKDTATGQKSDSANDDAAGNKQLQQVTLLPRAKVTSKPRGSQFFTLQKLSHCKNMVGKATIFGL